MFRFVLIVALCFSTLGYHFVLGGQLRRPALRLDGRIVGGKDTDIEEVPYQLSLHYNGWYRCGASIISNNYALTAAHCVHGIQAFEISFRAGSSVKESNGTVHQAEKITIHPKYDNFDFDYALLEVSTPFLVGSSEVQIVPLADNEPSENEIGLTSGWGALSFGGSSPKQLQSVEVPIVDRNKCQQSYYGYPVTKRMICAGYEKGGKDACQGDSGSPLVVNGKLAGIVSWGKGCAFAYYPGVYSNVAAVRDWIRENSGV